MPSVCIVTSEIVGPPGSGGIGTSMTGLAEHLAAAGCRVSILYTGSIAAPDIHLDPWKAKYEARGIELAALSIEALKWLAGPVRDHGFGTPYLVYQYLTAKSFDVVHFNDYGGEGSLCLAARKLGLAFRDTLLVVAMHGPSEWALELNRARPLTLAQSAVNHAERLSVKNADVLWSPSQYLLDWTRQHGFDLPPQTIVRQYCLPASPASPRTGLSEPVTEIVFFGRLEARKGLPLFCDALDVLGQTLADRRVSVAFLGKSGVCEGMDGLAYVASRSKTWPFAVKAVTHLGQPEAIAYLRAGGKLAVMASPADNSPCTVYEALSWGIPFLAARVGGVPELVHPDDHSRVLFDCTTAGLSTSLRCALDQGPCVAAPAVPQEETRRQWTAFHAKWGQYLTPAKSPASTGRVLAIVDGTSAVHLDRTLESLAAINTIHDVIVLTRDGAGAHLVGDAVGKGAHESVLLIHGGTTIHAAAFEQMRSALTMADIDGLQPAGELTVGSARKIIPPLGVDPVFTLFKGATFTGGLFLRRASFARIARVRSCVRDHPFRDYADHCATSGLEIWPYPQPVFTQSFLSANRADGSLQARLQALAEGSDADRLLAAKVMQFAGKGDAPRRGRVVWALRLIDLGLAPVVRLASSTRRRLSAFRSRRWINHLDG